MTVTGGATTSSLSSDFELVGSGSASEIGCVDGCVRLQARLADAEARLVRVMQLGSSWDRAVRFRWRFSIDGQVLFDCPAGSSSVAVGQAGRMVELWDARGDGRGFGCVVSDHGESFDGVVIASWFGGGS